MPGKSQGLQTDPVSTFQGLAQIPLGFRAIYLLCVSDKSESINFRAINTLLLILWVVCTPPPLPPSLLPCPLSSSPSLFLKDKQRHNRNKKRKIGSHLGVAVVLNTLRYSQIYVIGQYFSKWVRTDVYIYFMEKW